MILDGKALAHEIRSEIKQEVLSCKRKPGLAFLLVGKHPASLSYVQAKKKACAEVGIESKLIELDQTSSQTTLLDQIALLNRDPKIDGILVQLPLPPSISEKIVAQAIVPEKDVDGFHPLNAGKLLLGEEDGFIPCTPLGIHTLLQRTHIPIEGKHVIIVGRSNLVGKPLAALLVQKKPHCNATVTIAHSKTPHLSLLTRQADILVAAMGSPQFITADMVRPGSSIIDVGINRLPNGKIVGDVDYPAVSPLVSHITPVPGGIGPMTIAMLLKNTLSSYLRRQRC